MNNLPDKSFARQLGAFFALVCLFALTSTFGFGQAAAPTVVPVSAPAAADPRTDLKTFMAEMIRLIDANDLVGMTRLTWTPEMAALGLTPEQIVNMRPARELKALQAVSKQEAAALHSIMDQTPAMSDDGTRAKFALQFPQTFADGRNFISFYRQDGHWNLGDPPSKTSGLSTPPAVSPSSVPAPPPTSGVVPTSTPGGSSAADPRSDLKSLIVALIAAYDAKDEAAVFKLVLPPETTAAIPVEALLKMETPEQKASFLSIVNEVGDLYRSIKDQTPVMSANGTVATYTLPQPGPKGIKSLGFHKTNGLWFPIAN